MIVVFGMAHSGTTIFTEVLSQYQGYHLHTSGPQSWLLECAEIAPGGEWNAKTLKDLESSLPTDKELLIKRPWAESRYEWWLDNFPDAAFVCMIRDFVSCYDSWTSGHGLAPDLRKATPEEAWERYESHLLYAALFPLEKIMLVDHGRLCRWPKKTMISVANFLGIDFQFDVRHIGRDNVKNRLWGKHRQDIIGE